MDDKVLASELKNCDLFLNATPSGLEGSPVKPGDFLSPKIFVYDAVYAKNTPLLEAAAKAGSPRLGGLGMLIRQGALSFSLWTGKEPPVDLMKKALSD